MRRDAIFQALTFTLVAIWAAAALVASTAAANLAPWWLVVAIAGFAVLNTWLVYSQVHGPRRDEEVEHASNAREGAVRLIRAEAELARVVAVLDAVPEAVIATDSAGVVRLSNAAARDLFDTLETPGRSIEDVFTHGEVLALHARALAGRPGQEKIRHKRLGSLRVYEVVACPLTEAPGGGGPARSRLGAVIVLRDVTELALAVQLKTDFVANASHELRTPLSSIRLASETIRDAGADDPTLTARLAGVVLSNTSRLEELVRDLLDLSRVESPDVPPAREPVILSEMIATIDQLFEEVKRARHLRIDSSIDPDANEFISDPRLVELILKNLIDNATKYAFEGTTVRVVASRLASDLGGPPTIRIRVVDNGVGIPLADQQRIFERFYQVDNSRSWLTARRGTGLGLAIVKHALKRLGGTIRVESVWQQGTTMIVDLAAHSAAEPSV
jgi:two-component system phosphate regulon sensor histidine kinase PhoR